MKKYSLLLLSPLLLSSSLLSSRALAEDKPLAKLNKLTEGLAPAGTVAAEEVERLFEQGEVIAFRDATRGVTPQAINYAASCEKAIEAYQLKGAGPARVMVELALVLGGLNGTQAERFRVMLMASMGVKPEDARPMPELAGQLDEIGQWAASTVEKFATRLPADEAQLAHIRLAIARGQFAEAAERAQKWGAKGQAWRAAALILKGDPAPKGNFDGEGAMIVKGAKLRRARAKLVQEIAPDGNPILRCRKIFEQPAGTGDVALACATVLWDEPDRSWLPKAAKMVPAGAAGAPVRAAAALHSLFSGKHSEEILLEYRQELDQINASADEHRALWLMGNLAAAQKPLEWAPTSTEEQKQMLALDRGSPCDAATFALRTLAVRGNPPAMAAFAGSVVDRCVKDGPHVAADALGMLIALSRDPSSTVKSEAVEKMALSLAQAHPNDPEAIGAHADAVAAGALSKGGAAKAPVIALEAALARYEEAIRKSTPTSGAQARGRLEENAGMLSTIISERLDAKKRGPFLLRAQKHLRFALALDDNPAILATRAQFDLLAGMRMNNPPKLDQLPPSPARTRAACLLAAQAGVGTKVGEHYLSLARNGDKNPLDTSELLIAPQASFNVSLDERGLHPATVMRSQLWLAPPCDADHLPKRMSANEPRAITGEASGASRGASEAAVPPRMPGVKNEAARSTPESRTAVEK